jgi:HEAT repeat protein
MTHQEIIKLVKEARRSPTIFSDRYGKDPMRRILIAVLFIGAMTHLNATCKPMVAEQNDDAYPKIAAKKAEYALTVLLNQEYLAKDPQCVKAAMLYLGERHTERAVPVLIKLLTYHQGSSVGMNEEESQFGHIIPRDEEYPAIDGLYAMGGKAVPALIHVLATTDNTSVESRNALYAFMNIYREHVSRALRLLEQASKKQTDYTGATRLQRAAADARASWCHLSPCTQ